MNIVELALTGINLNAVKKVAKAIVYTVFVSGIATGCGGVNTACDTVVTANTSNYGECIVCDVGQSANEYGECFIDYDYDGVEDLYHDVFVSLSVASTEHDSDDIVGKAWSGCVSEQVLLWPARDTSFRGYNITGTSGEWTKNALPGARANWGAGDYACFDFPRTIGTIIQGTAYHSQDEVCLDDTTEEYRSAQCAATLEDGLFPDDFIIPDGNGGLMISIVITPDGLAPGPGYNLHPLD